MRVYALKLQPISPLSDLPDQQNKNCARGGCSQHRGSLAPKLPVQVPGVFPGEAGYVHLGFLPPALFKPRTEKSGSGLPPQQIKKMASNHCHPNSLVGQRFSHQERQTQNNKQLSLCVKLWATVPVPRPRAALRSLFPAREATWKTQKPYRVLPKKNERHVELKMRKFKPKSAFDSHGDFGRKQLKQGFQLPDSRDKLQTS